MNVKYLPDWAFQLEFGAEKTNALAHPQKKPQVQYILTAGAGSAENQNHAREGGFGTIFPRNFKFQWTKVKAIGNMIYK